MEHETSWHGLLTHLRLKTLAAGADESLEADMACVDAAWTAIRRRLGRCGIRQPRQLVLDPQAHPVVWLLPLTLARWPHWLHPLRRVLTVAKTATLFPRLDRGEGVAEVPVHQELVHDVLTGLNRPEPDVVALLTDARWEAVRSTAPLAVWRRTMQLHGLESLTSEENLGNRHLAPIIDVLALGQCPEVSIDCLKSLCMALAPHLRSTSERMVEPDGGPLTWSPVRLAVDKVEFIWTDTTAGSKEIGQYTVATKDGLTRVSLGSRHMATLSQGRWGILTAAYDPEDVCAALPAWVAQVEKDEATKGVATSQFWHGVRAALNAECIVGCNPLVAPSSFPIALRCWGTLEGWGHSWAIPPTRVVYNLLTQSPEEQRQLCRPLAAGGIWWALTRESTLDREVKAMLKQRGRVITVFKRGTYAAATKGSWRTATLKATQLREAWTIWASSGAAPSAPLLSDLKRRLDNIRLTADGVIPLDLTCLSAREATLGPAGAAYRYGGITVGTDGSLKSNGAMGAAYVAMGGRLPARSVAVHGSAASIRPELTAIALACEDCPLTEDLNILTDSLSSMELLKNLQRRDFPLSLYRHPMRQLATYVTNLINKRTAASVTTRLIKIKSHGVSRSMRQQMLQRPRLQS